MTYSIYEGNMERLEKKMVRIQNKCKKYGCDFHFAVVGEEFKEIETGEYDDNGDPITVTTRFVLVEAEGVAIVNGWQFVASLEHTENGNIINKAIEVEVPERYYTGSPICEHCGNKKIKYAYIVMNTETGEFKEVGRSCLKDFTVGMSAEGVAQYTSIFNELIEGEAPTAGHNCERYIEVAEYLKYAAETIRHFGYVKSGEADSTRDRAEDFYCYDAGWIQGDARRKKLRNLMADINFNKDSEESTKMVADAMAWLNSQEESNNYMHNLKTACGLKWTKFRNLGIICSLFPTFNKDLELQAKKKAEEENKKVSQHVGKVGERIEIKVKGAVVVTGWQTQWGYTCIYKIIDEDGNVFTWKTQSDIPAECKTIKATVKEHKEYNGEKQTEVTRCKCTEAA